MQLFQSVILILVCFSYATPDKSNSKKDFRDYKEADLERIFDQWEENDEPLEEDELPEYKRTPPPIDLSKINLDNPEDAARLTKQGRTLMTFVKVSGKPHRHEAEEITKLWQGALMNNHIACERYMIEDNRAIFLFRDGSQAWAAKDFLMNEDHFESITIDNKVYKRDDKHSVRLTEEL